MKRFLTLVCAFLITTQCKKNYNPGPTFVSANDVESSGNGTRMRASNLDNLRKRKERGIFRKKHVSLSSVLFPGVSPEEYTPGDEISMMIGLVKSEKTHVPFEYYNLPVCPAHLSAQKVKRRRKNLGERLGGHSVAMPAPYDIRLKEDISCQVLCKVKLDSKMVDNLVRLIQRHYSVQLSLDGLPAYVKSRDSVNVISGYPLGARLLNEESGKFTYFIHNHLRFVIGYNEDESFSGIRIVNFQVVPVTIKHDINEEKPNEPTSCSEGHLINEVHTLLPLTIPSDSEHLDVTYSYEVEWVKSDINWSDRWDIFLLGSRDDSLGHHMTIVNAFMVVIFLSIAVAFILIKVLRRDIAIYNSMDSVDDEDESGWKLIHGDVFRPPSTNPLALSIAVGTGLQIGLSLFLTLALGLTRFLNPMNKGQCLSYIVMLYIFTGSIAGYVSARLYKFFGGKQWKTHTLYTAVAFPGICVSMFLTLNIFLSFVGAATTVSFWVIILVFLLWACVSSPLVFLGSFFGFKAEVVSVPTRTNQIARVIPMQNQLVLSHLISLVLGGLPFSTICIEVYYILNAIWLDEFYYLMGYIFMAVALLVFTSTLVSTVMCYFRLCKEDHRWWWKTFLDGASVGLWMFFYSLWFLVSRLKLVGILPVIVYITYMGMISIAVSLICGAFSFTGTFIFLRTIYSVVKLD